MDWRKFSKEIVHRTPRALVSALVNTVIFFSLMLFSFWLFGTGHILLGRIFAVITILAGLLFYGPFLFLFW